ncbi:hypothetical protein C1646_754754 [Rhizophagus diaphanus]|nr:hypothetical protein C1646_754754 [Rhizophagus diaphanus] [Rhizophagus sp. MUCL 43196]
MVTQLSANHRQNVLEWIPYNRFYDVNFIAKVLNNSKNVTWEFINEVGDKYNCYNCVTQLYGISRDPETKNYIMVLEYAEHGSLRNYLK